MGAPRGPSIPGSGERKLRHKGKVQTVREWCAELKLPEEVVRSRLKRGWCPDDALGQPLGAHR